MRFRTGMEDQKGELRHRLSLQGMSVLSASHHSTTEPRQPRNTSHINHQVYLQVVCHQVDTVIQVGVPQDTLLHRLHLRPPSPAVARGIHLCRIGRRTSLNRLGQNHPRTVRRSMFQSSTFYITSKEHSMMMDFSIDYR